VEETGSKDVSTRSEAELGARPTISLALMSSPVEMWSEDGVTRTAHRNKQQANLERMRRCGYKPSPLGVSATSRRAAAWRLGWGVCWPYRRV
jgi:hypothetical protein